MAFRSIEWIADRGILRLLDQRSLPEATRYVDMTTAEAVAGAIADMTVRGAPVIGVAAAFGMVIAARASDGADRKADLTRADGILRRSRPTAVNLFWALDRMRRVWEAADGDVAGALEAEALAIQSEDIAVNEAISRHAMSLLPETGRVTFYHHCNTGSLATVDRGTALGIIRTTHEAGRESFTYVDETRPRLQGARLTAWELMQLGVPHAVVVDGASAHVMRTQHVDLCVVGCDRVAANGDTANKIGTYNLALAAADNGVPFYVAAPTSTIDLTTLEGSSIEIEERGAEEIIEVGGVPVAPADTPVFNPAFDVTPARLITAIITERGIVRPPFAENLKKLLGNPEGKKASA